MKYHKHKGVSSSHPVDQKHKDSIVQRYHNAALGIKPNRPLLEALKKNSVGVKIDTKETVQKIYNYAKKFFDVESIGEKKVRE